MLAGGFRSGAAEPSSWRRGVMRNDKRLVSKSGTQGAGSGEQSGGRVDAQRDGGPNSSRNDRRTLAQCDRSRLPAPGSQTMRIGITCYSHLRRLRCRGDELGLELARRGTRCTSSPTRVRFGCVATPSGGRSTRSRRPSIPVRAVVALRAGVGGEAATKWRCARTSTSCTCTMPSPNAATAWLAKQMLKAQRDLKIVTTLHGTDITLSGKTRPTTRLTKFSIEQSDRVTAVSAFLRDETYRAFGCAAATHSSSPTSSRRPSITAPRRHLPHLARAARPQGPDPCLELPSVKR